MAIKMTRDVILSVKEMLERQLNFMEIAARLNIDPDDIKLVLDFIQNIVS